VVRHLLSGDPVEQLESFPKRPFSTELRGLAGLLRRLLAAGVLPEQVVDETLRYYEPILKRVHPEDHPKRRRDLEHFAAMAARYRDLEQLLSDIALEPPNNSVDDVLSTDTEEGLLTLSTIHSAKGLEWHAVFIIWAAEGRFPSSFNVDDDDLEEERRLMYVAATRAKSELYLTYPFQMFDRGVGFVMAKPSRFIDGLPESVLQPVSLIDEGDL
jgi:DNA helicase-2/ATP-dependent DNA helicase PcrA